MLDSVFGFREYTSQLNAAELTYIDRGGGNKIKTQKAVCD
jgi:hypothetical protein